MLRNHLLLLLFFSLISTKAISQNKIKWLTWEQAIEKSKKEKKKIFVDVFTDWCGWCKKLDKTTFAEDHISKYINENFYPIKFDAEMETSVLLKGVEYKFIRNGNRGYHDLAAQLLQGKLSYPTMVFLDEDFNLIQAIPGFQETSTFEMIASYFGSNSHRSVPWNKYMQTFDRYAYFNLEVGKKD